MKMASSAIQKPKQWFIMLSAGNYRQTGAYLDRNITSLDEVCVWTLPCPTEQVSVDSTGSPNVQFNMDCIQ